MLGCRSTTFHFFFCTVWSTLIRISLTKALVLWWCDNKSDLIWFQFAHWIGMHTAKLLNMVISQFERIQIRFLYCSVVGVVLSWTNSLNRNLFLNCFVRFLLKSTSCHDRFLSVSPIACALTNCVNNQLVWFVMCLFAVSVQWDWRDREKTLVDFVSISWISLKNFYQTFCHICSSSWCIICIPVCNRVLSEYTGLFDHFHYIHYSSFIIYGRACQCVIFRLRRFVEISFMSSTFGE